MCNWRRTPERYFFSLPIGRGHTHTHTPGRRSEIASNIYNNNMYTAATQALVYYINVPFIITFIRDSAIVLLRDVVNP